MLAQHYMWLDQQWNWESWMNSCGVSTNLDFQLMCAGRELYAAFLASQIELWTKPETPKEAIAVST